MVIIICTVAGIADDFLVLVAVAPRHEGGSEHGGDSAIGREIDGEQRISVSVSISISISISVSVSVSVSISVSVSESISVSISVRARQSMGE